MGLPTFESRTKAAFEMFVVDRLGKVTNDSISQGAPPDDFVRVCGNQDGRNRVARLREMPVEFNSSHSRHLNVTDQARGFRKQRGSQEIACRGKRFDTVA